MLRILARRRVMTMEECLVRTEAMAMSILHSFALPHETLMVARILGKFGKRSCLDPLLDQVVLLTKDRYYSNAYLLLVDVLEYILSEVTVIEDGALRPKKGSYVTQRVRLLLIDVRFKILSLLGHGKELKALQECQVNVLQIPRFNDIIGKMESCYNGWRQEIIGGVVKGFSKKYMERDRKKYPQHNSYRDTCAYDHSILSAEPYLDASRIVLGCEYNCTVLPLEEGNKSSGSYSGAGPSSPRPEPRRLSDPQIPAPRVIKSKVWERYSCYISCHVPEPHSEAIFYESIREHNVRVVAMLNESSERSGQWYEYWPSGDVKMKVLRHEVEGVVGVVKLNYERDYFMRPPADVPIPDWRKQAVEYLTLREMTIYSVSKGGKVVEGSRHTFFHVHIRNWEDHGIPSLDVFLAALEIINACNDPGSSLAQIEHLCCALFRDVSHKQFLAKSPSMLSRLALSSGPSHSYESSSSLPAIDSLSRTVDQPILVHCHGGVGRTGTLIAIHHCISVIESMLRSRSSPLRALKDVEVNIVRIWARLCLQRPSVQGPVQLAYIYAAIRQYMQRVLPSQFSQLQRTEDVFCPSKFSRKENAFRMAAALDANGALRNSKEQYTKTMKIITGKDQDKYLHYEGERLEGSLFKAIDDERMEIFVSRICKLSKELHLFLGWLIDRGISLAEIDGLYRNIVKKPFPSALQILFSPKLHLLVQAFDVPLEVLPSQSPFVVKETLSKEDEALLAVVEGFSGNDSSLPQCVPSHKVKKKAMSTTYVEVGSSRLVKSTDSALNSTKKRREVVGRSMRV